MDSSLRIGISIIGSGGWLGGVYYIESLIKSVATIHSRENLRFFLLVSEITYHGLSYHESIFKFIDGFIFVVQDKIQSALPKQLVRDISNKGGVFCNNSQLSKIVDFIYPITAAHEDSFPEQCRAYWIPDFQHIDLPHFFSQEEIQSRNFAFLQASQKEKLIVLSSQDAAQKFRNLYPNSAAAIRVLSFHTLPEDQWYEQNPSSVRIRYGLPEQFLICVNQFWMHKGHSTLFNALASLRKRGVGIHLVCTGATSDYRNHNYFERLVSLIHGLGISDLVHILGTIPRNDQIQLIRCSLGVIQPSLYEGWSTVVEDSRTLGKSIILSDLPVHMEQNVENSFYFKANDAASLSSVILESLPMLVENLAYAPMYESRARANLLQLTRQFSQNFILIAREAQRLFSSKVNLPNRSSCTSSEVVSIELAEEKRLASRAANSISKLPLLDLTTENLKPTATVIVSTYKSDQFFLGLLENLSGQEFYRNGCLEIIVIDSASPGSEQTIFHKFQPPHPQQIIYVRTEERETIYASWNRAIRMARGTYIINANTDDRLRPDAIEVMARYLDEHPDVAMVYPYQLITDIPNETFETTQANRVFNWTTFNPEWLAQGYNLGSHLMWRASLHQKYGYFRPDLKSAGDYEFVLRIAKTEKIVCIPEVLGLYYNNQQGLSMNIAAALPETRRVQAGYGFHYNDVPLYQTQLSSHCRVLVITNLYPPQELGGYGRSLADFAAGLQSRGHQIHVLTSDAPYLGCTPDREDGIDRRLQLWGTYEGQTQELQDPNQINTIVVYNDRILREVLAQVQPDLCLVGNISFLGPAIFGPLLEQQIPTIHHLGFAQVPYPPTLSPQHPLYHLATASEAVAQAVRDSGLTQLETSTIYPGALVRQFSRPTLPQRDKLRILYAGLVIQTKGPHTLLEALTVLQQQQMDFECTIAGNAIHADYLAALQQYLQQTGLVHQVRLVGHLDRSQLADCFAQHNVFVFPSIQPEAFGIVQVEAMAAGLTVLSTGVGGASEVIESGVSGLLFPAGDPIALAQALISLPQDPERWARLAATGQAAAFAKFDIERSIDQLELKFEELLRRKAELSSPMALSIPTSPATDPYTQWLCDRITNVARVYGLDPNDQSTINLLRELRRQTAELWKAAPAEQLPDLYQGSVGQAYRSLLHSGFQSQPLTGEEANYLQALTNQVSQYTVQHPVGLQAFLGVMLYLPAGKMKVDQAPMKLPAWLLSDYQSVFEPPGTVEPVSAPQPIAPPTSATAPLHQDMTFLNRLLGCANLYYIDPQETSIAEELRLIRQQVGQIWAQTPLEQLESLYKSEFGRRYLALLDSGYQNYPLRPEEESVVQELTGLISQGIDRYPGLNALLAIMMYLPPGKMQVRDAANRLPAWLLPDYQRIFEAGQATTAPLVPSPQPTVPTAAPAAAAPPSMSQPPNLAEDMVFLNRFLGCSNLYEIDPEDGETVAELRQLRQRVAEFWLTVPSSQLEAVFNSELGRRYGMYLKSGFQREPLTDGERELLVKLAETVARGFDQPGGLNAFLGAMMYYAPGQMQVKDAATRLPGWLFPLYAAVFESEAQKKMTS